MRPDNYYEDSRHGLFLDNAHRIGHDDSHGTTHDNSKRPSRDASKNASGAHEVVTGSTDASLDHRLGRSVSIDQAARMLNVSRRTVYNRISDGRLRTIRTIGGSQRVLVESLFELGFRPRAFSTSASAASFAVRRVTRD